MSKVINFANELQLKINKASNGFYVLTEEPSDSEEDTVIQRSLVLQEDEELDEDLAEFKVLIKLFYAIKEFFSIANNSYYIELRLFNIESGKEVELD